MLVLQFMQAGAPIGIKRALSGALKGFASQAGKTQNRIDQISRQTVKDNLLRVLSRIKHSGDFCVGGSIEMPMPALKIEGVGMIALPLIPFQADAIKKVSMQASYGRGSEALIAHDVRNAFQIDSSQISMNNPEWHLAVDDLPSWFDLPRLVLEHARIL